MPFDAQPRAATPDLGEAYARFAPVVHGIALSHVGPVDADDVTQEVFLRAAERIGSLREPAAFPGWICALARNVALDRLRQRRRRGEVAVDADLLPARPEPPEDRALRSRVLALLARLPEAYREALVLRLVEGLAGPEIATLTGLTPGSVRVHLHRGFALLRPLLEKEGWA